MNNIPRLSPKILCFTVGATITFSGISGIKFNGLITMAGLALVIIPPILIFYKPSSVE